MRILYICTHNRCRSILSEALTNHYGGGTLKAASAGSQPVGEVHPLTLKYLKESGISIKGLASKSWDDMERFAPDVVVTVCDSAAGEACPLWFGNTIKIHWGLSDPSKVEGSDKEKRAAFLKAMEIIQSRVKALQALADENMSNKDFEYALKQLAR